MTERDALALDLGLYHGTSTGHPPTNGDDAWHWSDDTISLAAAAAKKGQAAEPGVIGFCGVPEEVWDFHVGSGCQVCEKWLKERKGRTLSRDDIADYHEIAVALHEINLLRAEIDETIDAHGRLPGAFITDPKNVKGLKDPRTWRPRPERRKPRRYPAHSNGPRCRFMPSGDLPASFVRDLLVQCKTVARGSDRRTAQVLLCKPACQPGGGTRSPSPSTRGASCSRA